jgi:hypothetical protein
MSKLPANSVDVHRLLPRAAFHLNVELNDGGVLNTIFGIPGHNTVVTV